MSDKPARDPRWPLVILWGVLSALALPVWVVGVVGNILRAPLRYAADHLNAELHRTVGAAAADVPSDSEPTADGS